MTLLCIEKNLDSTGSGTPSLTSEAAKQSYPLKYPWTMYYDTPNKRTTQENYNTNLQALATVDYVYTACYMIQNIPDASELPSGTSLSFFRSDIKPSWEDSHNANGGKWTCSIHKDGSKKISKLWKDAIFSCIGSEYEHPETINGVVLSIRQKTDRIAFWISDASHDDALKHIASFIKTYLELPADFTLSFQLHADALKGNSRDHLIF
ncbi:translation initiation factor [Mitosporidium daphniae]|uniref:Putative eukaryotic initiation factor n=1 Tax=Mitosporidium daphniae TaxID=1485682 RepID=A0A098VUY9_9MICR|nr:putative eukaryotic initiation factor [Mitosporidium daphniae]KGG52755.1 putative eukaryotic initiation factor [Mitosporidium daphniae]|eukprot:XP_013239191.1 putative eukaryotic initiation factor [Mitosporidium daphniae]